MRYLVCLCVFISGCALDTPGQRQPPPSETDGGDVGDQGDTMDVGTMDTTDASIPTHTNDGQSTSVWCEKRKEEVCQRVKELQQTGQAPEGLYTMLCKAEASDVVEWECAPEYELDADFH